MKTDNDAAYGGASSISIVVCSCGFYDRNAVEYLEILKRDRAIDHHPMFPKMQKPLLLTDGFVSATSHTH